MQLIIDQGNTNIKIYYFEQNKIIKKIIFPTQNEKIFFEGNPQKVIYSSVSGFKKEILDFFSGRLLCFDTQTLIPIENCYQSPTLGVDRLAAAVGAFELFPNTNCLIIDIGTAITFDVLTKDKKFLGGNISPGIDLRYKALHDYTKKLPFVDDKKINNNIIANNTVDAIKNGVLYGILFEIQNYITHFQNIYSDLQVILTGGDANFFVDKIKFVKFVEPNLVAIGLNNILNFNTLKKNDK